MSILETSPLKIKSDITKTILKNKTIEIYSKLLNKRIVILELQEKYFDFLAKNNTIAETVDKCIVNGIKVHFQSLYQLVINLNAHGFIQNQQVSQYISENQRKKLIPSYIKNLNHYENLEEIPKPPFYNIEYLGKIPFFHNMTYKLIEKMYHSSKISIVKKTKPIVKEGDTYRNLYLLLEGEVLVLKKNGAQYEQMLAKISAPAIFGEGGFFFNQPRSADIRANTDCLLAQFPYDQEYDSFFKVRDEKFLLHRFWLLHAFSQSQLFKAVPLDTIEYLLSLGMTRPLYKNEILFKENEYGDKLFILIQGHLNVFQNGVHINSLSQGKCLGEIALFRAGKRTATIAAAEDSILFEISRQEFFPLMAKNLFLAMELERISEIRIARDQKRKAK